MPAPIELRLSAPKPRLVVGEGIVLDLNVRVLSGIEMVSPELNRNRTSIRVEPRTASQQVLTGIDYVRVHRISPLTQIEDAFHADAGAAWTVPVELLNYAPPLPADRYAISLSYRFGDSEADTVSSNTVEIEIVPAELITVSFRWFGGASARDVLGGVWTARTAQGEQWFWQCADAFDPGALQFTVALGSPARRPGARPALAHLNDIHAMHFEKYVVWEQDGAVGYMRVHRSGFDEPGFVEHGLGTDARLIHPPLQQNDDSLLALVLGTGANGQPACSLVSVGGSGGGTARIAPLRSAASEGFALWPADGGAALVLLSDSAGRVSLMGAGRSGEILIPRPVQGLQLSQWMGAGIATGYFRENDFLHLFAMDPQARNAEPRIPARFETGRFPVPPGRFMGSGSRENGGCVLLFESQGGWLVLDGSQVFDVPRPSWSTGSPHVVPAAGGLYLVHHDPARGFVAELLGEPAPAPLI